MILVVGSINMDVSLRVAHIPAVGETILASARLENPGGKGANQAVAAAKLGGEVCMIGRVGADAYGQVLLASLRAYGVDAQGVQQDEKEASGMAFICVSDAGDNAITVSAGANAALAPEQIRGASALFERAEYCITQLETPLPTVLAVARMCREHKVRLIVNPSPAQALPDELLCGLAFLVPNEHELQRLMGVSPCVATDAQLCAYIKEKKIANLIVTLGEQGCLWASGEGVRRFPAHRVKAVDTTGAGDCFLGAFTAALSRGMQVPQAIGFATQAAAITVGRMGAQQAMPTRDEMNL